MHIIIMMSNDDDIFKSVDGAATHLPLYRTIFFSGQKITNAAKYNILPFTLNLNFFFTLNLRKFEIDPYRRDNVIKRKNKLKL